MTDKIFVSGWNDQTFAVLMNALVLFLNRMPNIPGLNATERKAIQNVAEGRLAYVEKALEFAKDYQTELNIPADELAKLEQIGSDYEKLMHLRRLIAGLLASLMDGSILVGGNFFEESKIVHQTIDLAVKKGKSKLRIPLEELDKLYADQGNRRGNNNGNSEDTPPSDNPDGGDTPTA
jgi:hypothetical protein